MQKAIGKTENDYGILAVCSFTRNARQVSPYLSNILAFFSAPEF